MTLHARRAAFHRLATALAALVMLPVGVRPPSSAGEGSLPIVEVPADSGHGLALLLSGDGGWAGGDRAIAAGLAQGGVAVVGLDVRAYLRGGHRTPEGFAGDAAAILERYAARWHRDRLVLVGYSRGANLAPFAASRWPEPLRRRIALVALVGPTEFANFEFHWEDMLHVVRRAGDLSTRAEIERLRGTPILCVAGEGESTSLCPTLDRTLVHAVRHAGGHVLDARSGAAVAAMVLASLR